MRWFVAGLAGAVILLQYLAPSAPGILGYLLIAIAVGAASITQLRNDPASKKRELAEFSNHPKGQHRQPYLGKRKGFTEVIGKWREAVSGSPTVSKWTPRAALALSTSALAITLVGFPGFFAFMTMADDPQGLDGLPIVGSVPSTTSYAGQSIMDFSLNSGVPSETTFRESYPNVRYLNSKSLILTVKGSSCSGSETAEYVIYSGTHEVDSGAISTGNSQGGIQNVAIGARQFLRMKFALLAPVGCSGTLSLFNPTLDKSSGWKQSFANAPGPIGP